MCGLWFSTYVYLCQDKSVTHQLNWCNIKTNPVIAFRNFFSNLLTDVLRISFPRIVIAPCYAPTPNRRGHKVMMLSYVCLTSVAYIGPKWRTERPRKTKIGTEVAHVTRDLDTTFKVKRSRSSGHFAHHHVGMSGGCSSGRGNVLAVGKPLLRCRLLGGAKALQRP